MNKNNHVYCILHQFTNDPINNTQNINRRRSILSRFAMFKRLKPARKVPALVWVKRGTGAALFALVFILNYIKSFKSQKPAQDCLNRFCAGGVKNKPARVLWMYIEYTS